MRLLCLCTALVSQSVFSRSQLTDNLPLPGRSVYAELRYALNK